jgi:hypothetical protein
MKANGEYFGLYYSGVSRLLKEEKAKGSLSMALMIRFLSNPLGNGASQC